MAELDDTTWLHRTFYQETLKVYASVWDIYIKFYTVFLTANVAGLGIVLQYVERGNRWPIALAFGLQNVITAGTSWGVARYSLETDDKLRRVAQVMSSVKLGEVFVDPVIQESPAPRKLATRAGYANCIACALHICFWIAVCLIKDSPSDGHHLQPLERISQAGKLGSN